MGVDLERRCVSCVYCADGAVRVDVAVFWI